MHYTVLYFFRLIRSRIELRLPPLEVHALLQFTFQTLDKFLVFVPQLVEKGRSGGVEEGCGSDGAGENPDLLHVGTHSSPA